MKFSLLLLLALAAASGNVLAAESYPTRPVRMIAPFPPGGPTDVLARTIAAGLTQAWGQQIVVDNRPGAAGNIGAEMASRAAGDGYTLLMGTVATHAINESLYAKLAFNPHRDFVAVALAAQTPSAVLVHPSIPARRFSDLMAIAKAKGKGLTYASAGIGTIGHLSIVMLNMQAGIDVTHVPYKGTGPALNDTIAGQTHFLISSTLTSMPHIKSGRLRPLAVTSAKRSAALPDLPTVAESGLHDYVVVGWAGVFAPARTPTDLVRRINADINTALSDPAARDRLLAAGSEPAALTAPQFREFALTETARWARVVKQAGIQPQ
jgi:tripartite-type tricarboxylate transporter receptor subunit TctC